ncbi:hypothetical protein I350_00799 [Cryptococcus amylolentus CBS 6273]|uniref:RING-type domain-containing protein n=1 Tax=Cryptococcus amylolentus CBS 6273 TaxID=1296118 RepID=A0A1E3KG76_9TREE|nr:hypothetical protein I350_00799 [Cryptococcus amylolentus CBS 6273]
MDPPEQPPPAQQPPEQHPEAGPPQPFFTMTIAVPGLPPPPPGPGQEGEEPADGEHNGPGAGAMIYTFQIGAGPPPGEGEHGNADHPPLPPDFFSQFAQPPGAPAPGGNGPEGADGAAPPPAGGPPAWLFAPFLEFLLPRRDPQPNPEKAAELLRSLPTVGKRLLKRVDNVVAAQDVDSYEDEEERGWKCGICLEGMSARQEEEVKEDKKVDETIKGEEKGEDTTDKKEETEEKKDNQEELKKTTGVKALPCNHLFHGDCLEPWFATHHTCPTCRLDLDPLYTLDSPPRASRPARTESIRPAHTGAGSTRASANAHPYARGDRSEGSERPQPPSRQASSSSIPPAGPSTTTPGAATGDESEQAQTEQRQDNGQPQRPVPRRSQTSHHFFIFSNSPFPPTPRGEQPPAPATGASAQTPASGSVPPLQAANTEPTSSADAPDASSPAAASTSAPSQPAASLGRSSAPEPSSSRPGSPHPEGHEDDNGHSAAHALLRQLDIPSLLDGLFGLGRPPAPSSTDGAPAEGGQEASASSAEASAQPARSASAPVEGSGPAPEGSTGAHPADANPAAPNGAPEPDVQQRAHMQMIQSTMDLISRMARARGDMPPPLPTGQQGGPGLPAGRPDGLPAGLPAGLPSFLFSGPPMPRTEGEGTPGGSRSGTPGGESPPRPQQPEEPSKPPFVPQSLESWTEEKEKVLGWRCEAPECMYGPTIGEEDEDSEMPAVEGEDKQDKEMINIFSPLQPAISLEAAKQAHTDDHRFTILACSHRWHRGCLEGAARSAGREIKDDGEGKGWVRCERCRNDGWVVPRELEGKGKGKEVPIKVSATTSVVGKKRDREDDDE